MEEYALGREETMEERVVVRPDMLLASQGLVPLGGGEREEGGGGKKGERRGTLEED